MGGSWLARPTPLGRSFWQAISPRPNPQRGQSPWTTAGGCRSAVPPMSPVHLATHGRRAPGANADNGGDLQALAWELGGGPGAMCGSMDARAGFQAGAAMPGAVPGLSRLLACSSELFLARSLPSSTSPSFIIPLVFAHAPPLRIPGGYSCPFLCTPNFQHGRVVCCSSLSGLTPPPLLKRSNRRACPSLTDYQTACSRPFSTLLPPLTLLHLSSIGVGLFRLISPFFTSSLLLRVLDGTVRSLFYSSLALAHK